MASGSTCCGFGRTPTPRPGGSSPSRWSAAVVLGRAGWPRGRSPTCWTAWTSCRRPCRGWLPVFSYRDREVTMSLPRNVIRLGIGVREGPQTEFEAAAQSYQDEHGWTVGVFRTGVWLVSGCGIDALDM